LRISIAAPAFALLLSACAGEPSAWTFKDGIGSNPSGPPPGRFAQIGGSYIHANAASWWWPAFSVDSFSRLDEIFPAGLVNKPATASSWKRAAKEPDYRYDAPARFGAGHYDLDGYLARNPTTGLLIAKGETILVERYQYARTDAHRFTSFSMAKTITALLVGIAVSEGHIRSIEDTAETYATALAGTEYGKTPIRHLLTMSSGVQFHEDYDGSDDSAKLSAAAIRRKSAGGAATVRQFNTRIAQPGERWHYSSGETQVLGIVLTAATKRPIVDYLTEKVWQPMGAESDATWLIDAAGQEATYSFFNAVLRDYARFGRMLAHGGRVGDRQIVPADWLAQATRPHFSSRQTRDWYGYGFQTWIFPQNDGTYALLGVRGQAIYVDPAQNLVMVHTAVRPSALDPGVAETVALWFAVRQQSRNL